ncbi:invasion associated locus B family protein [Salinarimonas soli]|uniref:Invasion associated locus B family protein n=1 Tax=Salinarimonas soli TaxID=1638099 RepID=A0A5B2VDF2_9HYPH|nr:invasion associated locus B family protein [Salinarimonas soli]KAA2236974.1 invasion associated locus B family protein [Salinarimonas soli]
MSSTTRLARLRGSTTILAAAALAAGLLAPLAASAQGNPPAPRSGQRPAQTPAQPAAPAPAPAAPAAPGGAAGAAGAGSGPSIVTVKAEPSQPEWTKVCGRDQAQNAEICYTTRDFVSDQGQPVLAVAVYDVKTAQPQRIVRFLMPLGLLLQPGIRFAPDNTQATPGRYAICFPNGCFAEGPVSNDALAALKKGTTLNVSVQNQVGREVTFAVPLAGFGKAFDGAAIDPKVLEEQQRKLQEELEKRSDELRKRLESSAGGAAAPGAPAPAPR